LIAIATAVAIRGAGPSGSAVLLAIPASLSGTLGLYAYYRGMAVGAMSVVAPIAGISAIVPVTFGLATGDQPSPFQMVGIVVALVGVGLASREHQEGSGASPPVSASHSSPRSASAATSSRCTPQARRTSGGRR
jgi:drug/metabolite transporter (DMT)-like permease